MLLAWARDRSGLKVRASALDPRDRRSRAPFTCLGCGEVLVAHLGRIRAPHFAHAPGSRCPLTAPETALHLDAKERLLVLAEDAFARRRRVVLLARCPSCRRPDPRDLAALGDSAEPEGAVGPLRADVLVSSGGRPALAIEVKVTHAVDPEKEAALATLSVPAVEVDAREEWEREEPGGGIAIACARSLGFPPCASCAALARAEKEREKGGEAAEVAELEAYRARGLLGAPPVHAERMARRADPAPSVRPERWQLEPVKPSVRPERRGHAAVPESRGAPSPARVAPSPASPDAPLTSAERADLARRFRCPDCAGRAIAFGERLAKHACDGGPVRPIAWRGYDGTLVLMRWWSR